MSGSSQTIDAKASPRSTGAAATADRRPALRLEGLCLTYPIGVKAVCSVDLRVEAGEQVAILGASGSGKSSLLGCLSGRLTPTAGQLDCRGRVAVIHQDLRLVKQKTAIENVLHGSMQRVGMWRSLVRFPRQERERAAQLLKRVGLGHRLRHPVGRLSGGEQQRVAIARAIMQDPAILLADEPVASLDPENAQATMQLLSRLGREDGLTIVAVLHDEALAERFADRVLRMRSGRLPNAGEQPECSTQKDEATTGGFALPQAQMPEHEGPCPAQSPGSALRPSARSWKWAAAVAAAAVLVWSIAGLRVTGRQLEGALPSLARFARDLWPDSWQQVAEVRWGLLLGSLVETLQMAVLGTTLGVLIGWPLAALAAHNVGPRLIHRPMRLMLNAVRTVPSLIWALLFVAAVGLGPLSGVLALAAYSVGYLTKFFYEGFEDVEPGPVEALREMGANGPQRFFHAVWPAARPAVLAASLFMVEYNVRAASVLGLVGAGGIGTYLMLYFEYRDFTGVLACLALILAVVVGLDALSSRLRTRLVRG